MSNTVPTDYTDKATLVDWDKGWGFDSEANDNKNFTMLAVFNYITSKITTTNVAEWTNLYFTSARFDTDFAAKDTDDLSEWATNKYATATSVNDAWATMNSDTSLVWNSYFLDEDDLASNDATKVPSQQSVKAYVDNFPTVLTSTVVSSIAFPTTPASNVLIAHWLWRIPRKIITELQWLNAASGTASYDWTTITQKVYADNWFTWTPAYIDFLLYQWNGWVNNYGRRSISAIDATNITLAYNPVWTASWDTLDFRIDFIW